MRKDMAFYQYVLLKNLSEALHTSFSGRKKKLKIILLLIE